MSLLSSVGKMSIESLFFLKQRLAEENCISNSKESEPESFDLQPVEFVDEHAIEAGVILFAVVHENTLWRLHQRSTLIRDIPAEHLSPC